MSEADRLGEIKAQWGLLVGDEMPVQRSYEDIQWLIAEVERLREVLDGGRTPKQLMQRLEVLQLAGVPPTAEVIAYADRLLDEMSEEHRFGGRPIGLPYVGIDEDELLPLRSIRLDPPVVIGQPVDEWLLVVGTSDGRRSGIHNVSGEWRFEGDPEHFMQGLRESDAVTRRIYEKQIAQMEQVIERARIVVGWASTERLDALRDALRELDCR